MSDQDFIISNEAQLESVIGEPMEFLRAKVVPVLDDSMREFIQRAPLVFLSTIDADGGLDISPKGDAPGFVTWNEHGQLLVPERPGNKLTFGFRNLLNNPQLGMIFVVPNTRETLRVKGRATITKEPALLQQLQAHNKPALLCTVVDVEECFFHCGKAMIRSNMWQPDKWGEPAPSLMARQITKEVIGDPSMEPAIEEEIERGYKEDLY